MKLKLETKNKMQLLDGKKTAEDIKLKSQLNTKIKIRRKLPHLAAVIVGRWSKFNLCRKGKSM
jgi:hypothetical protein